MIAWKKIVNNFLKTRGIVKSVKYLKYQCQFIFSSRTWKHGSTSDHFVKYTTNTPKREWDSIFKQFHKEIEFDDTGINSYDRVPYHIETSPLICRANNGLCKNTWLLYNFEFYADWIDKRAVSFRIWCRSDRTWFLV